MPLGLEHRTVLTLLETLHDEGYACTAAEAGAFLHHLRWTDCRDVVGGGLAGEHVCPHREPTHHPETEPCAYCAEQGAEAMACLALFGLVEHRPDGRWHMAPGGWAALDVDHARRMAEREAWRAATTDGGVPA